MHIEEPQLSELEVTALEEVARHYQFDRRGLNVITLSIKGYDVPVVSSKTSTDLYAVVISESSLVKAVLKQEIIVDENGLRNYRHYANDVFIGDYKKGKKNELVEFQGHPADEPVLETHSPCEANEGESCAGCHYRQMKDIIAEDGDTQALCDAMNALGGLCDAQVYIAATIHCWLEH